MAELDFLTQRKKSSGTSTQFAILKQDDVQTTCSLRSAELTQSYTLQTLTKQAWPSKTRSLCWWCCHSFDCLPVGIPQFFDGHSVFELNGNFCSLNCARAFCEHEYSHREQTAVMLLAKMAETVFDIRWESVRPAPSRFLLKKFGGSLTIEKFRTDSNKHALEQVPFISSAMLMRSNLPENRQTAADSKEQCVTDVAQSDTFQVRGLRKPSEPLPPEKILCEQNIPKGEHLYQKFCDQKDGSACTRTRADTAHKNQKRMGSRLDRFMKKKN